MTFVKFLPDKKKLMFIHIFFTFNLTTTKIGTNGALLLTSRNTED